MIDPANIPLSLYIHTPWCIKKCPYCDFNSHQSGMNELPEAQYLQALMDDLEQEIKAYSELSRGRALTERPIETVFIGGGTPSLLSAGFYQQLFEQLKSSLLISPSAEITLEANPGSLEEKTDLEKLQGFRKAGINRLSIGVQSFDDVALRSLGRIHNSGSATKAFHTAREAGFDNINIDLMFGLSSQSIDEALLDLQKAIDLSPEHISWYELTIEPNTVFYSSPPHLPDDDVLFEIAEQGRKLLASAGYGRYEISAYSKRGRQSAHNLNYWRFGDYIGIGAGAHGKLSTNNAVMRRSKTRMPQDYLNASEINKLASHAIISNEELPFEFMLNALRLIDGFDLRTFGERTGLAAEVIANQLNKLVSQQLLRPWQESAADPRETQQSHPLLTAQVIPTARGMQLHNELVAAFMP